jgi:Family of unknown function (DUF6152)
MRIRQIGLVVIVISLSTFCVSLSAHHGSNISYDLGKQVSMTGVVAEINWVNPHVFVLYDVTDEKGNTVRWGAETHTPAQLKEAGWTKNMVKAGDRVEITVFPSKVGAPRGLLSKLVDNGKVIIDDGDSRNR